MSSEKDQLVQTMLNIYDASNRIGFCKLALRKYHFEKYKLTDFNIKDEDFILQDQEALDLITLCLEKKSCSKDELKEILDLISYNDLSYIGI